MPTALSDPSTTLYVILIVVAVLLALMWLRSRKSIDLLSLAIGVGALAAVFLIDYLVESPREEASRKIQEMAKAATDKKWDDMFQHISDSFKYKGPSGMEFDKKTLRERLKSIESAPEFKGIAVWDLHRADYRIVNENNATVGFRAQLRDFPLSQSYVIANFTKDPDGQWRMSGFARYDKDKQDRSAPVKIEGLD